MARPRKPTKLLDAKGAFKKDPQRKRTDPETTGPLGEPPDYMLPDEKERWEEIGRIAPLGVLTVADRPLIETAARLWAYCRRTPMEDLPTSKIDKLHTLLGRCGMSPADRAKISVPEQKKKNPFEAIG